MIFYLSSTGNTKWAAEQVAAFTDDELLFIPDVGADMTFQLKPSERIGFFFPVHGWRPPRIVREFVRRLVIPNSAGHYCYVVCTAGDNIGETIDIFESDLHHIGLHLDSAYSLIMPESYVGLPFMDVDTAQKEAQKKLRAEEELREYSAQIAERRTGERHLVIGKWPKTNSRLIGSVFLKWLISDSPFRVDEGKCTACGLCASLCPVQDILGGAGKVPVWKHNGKCLTCFSCYHHCPKKAISYGSRTKNKGQYYFERNQKRDIR